MSRSALINGHMMTLASLFVDSKFASASTSSSSSSAEMFAKLSGPFLALHDEYSEKLEEYRIENERIKTRIRDEKIADPWEDAEIKEFYKKYDTLLKKLNEGCLIELAKSSSVLLKKIEDANGEFLEDIIQLAQVYEVQDNVDFKSIEKMYDKFHEMYKEGCIHYRSCNELKRVFGHDPDELERQLDFHRLAAEAYGFDYVEDETKTGYSQLSKGPMTVINNNNSQNATRARDHLHGYAVGVLTCPEVWKLVEKRKNGEVFDSKSIAGTVTLNNNKDNIGRGSKIFSEARLKQMITDSATSTAKFLNRLGLEAIIAWSEDAGLTEDQRKTKALEANHAVRLQKANTERQRLDLEPFKTFEDYEEYQKENKRENTLKRQAAVKTSGEKVDDTVNVSSSSTGRSARKSKSSFTSVQQDASGVAQNYNPDQLKEIENAVTNVKIGERFLSPQSGDLFVHAMKTNIRGAHVVTENGCVRTRASRDYAVGEIIVQVGVISRLPPGERCETFSAVSLGNDVWMESPYMYDLEKFAKEGVFDRDLNAGPFHPDVPFMYTQCPYLETEQKYCNLLQQDDSTLKVIEVIRIGDFMISYGDSAVKELAKDKVKAKAVSNETHLNANALQLKVLVSLVMDLERDVLETIYLKLIAKKASYWEDLKAKFSNIDVLIHNQFKLGAFVKSLVDDLSWTNFVDYINSKVVADLADIADESVDDLGNVKDVYLMLKDFHDAIVDDSFLALNWRIANRDKVFNLNDLSIVQRYLSFHSVRNVIFQSRFGYPGDAISLQFRDSFIERMIEFKLRERFCVSSLPRHFCEDPYSNNEYEFMEPLGPDWYKCESLSFPHVVEKKAGKTRKRLKQSGSKIKNDSEDEYDLDAADLTNNKLKQSSSLDLSNSSSSANAMPFSVDFGKSSSSSVDLITDGSGMSIVQHELTDNSDDDGAEVADESGDEEFDGTEVADESGDVAEEEEVVTEEEEVVTEETNGSTATVADLDETVDAVTPTVDAVTPKVAKKRGVSWQVKEDPPSRVSPRTTTKVTRYI